MSLTEAKKTKPVSGTLLTGLRVSVAVDDLVSFIEQAIEPLRKEGGQMSITVDVVYRPAKK